MQTQIDTLTDDKNALNEKLSAAGDFDAQMAPRILQRRARRASRWCCSAPPTPRTTTSKALTRLVEQAGGTVTGTVALTQEFVDANSAEKLLSVVNSPIVPAGAQLSTTSGGSGLAGRRPARASHC